MPKITYRGPGHRLVAFGQTLRRGESGDFSEQEARSLFSQPNLQLEHEREPVPRPTSRGSRSQWAAHAESLGVPITNAMSRAEIIAAVDASPSGDGEPEAGNGEGHQANTQQEE